jgi:hypothetical protein
MNVHQQAIADREAEIRAIRDSLRGATAEERRWITRLSRVMKAQPRSLRVVAGGVVRVYLDKAEHGHDVATLLPWGWEDSP